MAGEEAELLSSVEEHENGSLESLESSESYESIQQIEHIPVPSLEREFFMHTIVAIAGMEKMHPTAAKGTSKIELCQGFLDYIEADDLQGIHDCLMLLARIVHDRNDEDKPTGLWGRAAALKKIEDRKQYFIDFLQGVEDRINEVCHVRSVADQLTSQGTSTPALSCPNIVDIFEGYLLELENNSDDFLAQFDEDQYQAQYEQFKWIEVVATTMIQTQTPTSDYRLGRSKDLFLAAQSSPYIRLDYLRRHTFELALASSSTIKMAPPDAVKNFNTRFHQDLDELNSAHGTSFETHPLWTVSSAQELFMILDLISNCIRIAGKKRYQYDLANRGPTPAEMAQGNYSQYKTQIEAAFFRQPLEHFLSHLHNLEPEAQIHEIRYIFQKAYHPLSIDFPEQAMSLVRYLYNELDQEIFEAALGEEYQFVIHRTDSIQEFYKMVQKIGSQSYSRLIEWGTEHMPYLYYPEHHLGQKHLKTLLKTGNPREIFKSLLNNALINPVPLARCNEHYSTTTHEWIEQLCDDTSFTPEDKLAIRQEMTSILDAHMAAELKRYVDQIVNNDTNVLTLRERFDNAIAEVTEHQHPHTFTANQCKRVQNEYLVSINSRVFQYLQGMMRGHIHDILDPMVQKRTLKRYVPQLTQELEESSITAEDVHRAYLALNEELFPEEGKANGIEFLKLRGDKSRIKPENLSLLLQEEFPEDPERVLTEHSVGWIRAQLSSERYFSEADLIATCIELGDTLIPEYDVRTEITENMRLLGLIGVQAYELLEHDRGAQVRLFFQTASGECFFDGILINYENASVHFESDELPDWLQHYLRFSIWEIFTGIDAEMHESFVVSIQPSILATVGIVDPAWTPTPPSTSTDDDDDEEDEEETAAEESHEEQFEYAQLFLNDNLERFMDFFETSAETAKDILGRPLAYYEFALAQLYQQFQQGFVRQQIPDGGLVVHSQDHVLHEVTDSLRIYNITNSQQYLSDEEGLNPALVGHQLGNSLIRFNFRDASGENSHFFGALVPMRNAQPSDPNAVFRLMLYGVGERDGFAEAVGRNVELQKIMIILEMFALKAYMRACFRDEEHVQLTGEGPGTGSSGKPLKPEPPQLTTTDDVLPAATRYIYYDLEEGKRRASAGTTTPHGPRLPSANKVELIDEINERLYGPESEAGLAAEPLYASPTGYLVLSGSYDAAPIQQLSRPLLDKAKAWLPLFATDASKIEQAERALLRDHCLIAADISHPLYEQHLNEEERALTHRERAKLVIERVFAAHNFKNELRTLTALFGGDVPFLSLHPMLAVHLGQMNTVDFMSKLSLYLWSKHGNADPSGDPLAEPHHLSDFLKVLVDAGVCPSKDLRISFDGVRTAMLRFYAKKHPQQSFVEDAYSIYGAAPLIPAEFWDPDLFRESEPTPADLVRIIEDTRFAIFDWNEEVAAGETPSIGTLPDGRPDYSTISIEKLVMQARGSSLLEYVIQMRELAHHPHAAYNNIDVNTQNVIAMEVVLWDDGSYGYLPIPRHFVNDGSGAVQMLSYLNYPQDQYNGKSILENVLDQNLNGTFPQFQHPSQFYSAAQVQRLVKENVLEEEIEEIESEGETKQLKKYSLLKNPVSSRIIILPAKKWYRQFLGREKITVEDCMKQHLQNGVDDEIAGLQESIRGLRTLLSEATTDDAREAHVYTIRECEQRIIDLGRDRQGYFDIREGALDKTIQLLFAHAGI